jgi:P4 family phage/plasmid primase-like protien
MPPSIPDSEIQRIKDEIDMVALVGQYVDAPVKRSGNGQYVTHCPFHDEKTPSFTLSPDKGFMKCFGCDWKGDVIQFVKDRKGIPFPEAALLLGARAEDTPGNDRQKPRKPAPPRKTAPTKKQGTVAHATPKPVRDTGATADTAVAPPTPRGHTLEAIYDYQRPDGSVAHQKIRFQPKTFRQRRPLAPGELAEWEHRQTTDPKFKAPYHQDGWVYSLEGTLLYPYRLPDLIAADPADPIFLCEGEKDCDTLAGLGLHSTMLTDKDWRDEYKEWFRDRWIVIVEDHDPYDARIDGRPGEIHAARVGKGVMPVAARVTWLRMPEIWKDCPDGIDITDHVERCRETFQSDEDIRRDLLEAADAGEPPLPVLYEGYYELGEKGGTILLQDTLADRIMSHRRLLLAGGDFWQWRIRSEREAGTWRKVHVGAQIHDWIRKVLRTAEPTRRLIDARTLASVTTIMGSSRYAHPDEFNDHDPYLVNCQSGMLNVLTGELRPHDPRFLSTTQSPVRWDENAQCPQWLQILEQLQPDEEVRAQIQEMFGYCLVTAVNYHTFFFLFGDGGTGKSTVADILTALIGEQNTLALQLEELDNAFMRSQLVGKQLYLAGELTPRSFKHIGLIKQIVAGEPIWVDVKNKPGYTYRPRGRFVMTSNVVAHTPDTSGGFERRFLQIDFNNVIPKEDRDYELHSKLLTELPGIFKWAVDGFQRLHDRGRFEHTKASEEATKELMRHRASVKEFLHDDQWIRDDGPKDDLMPISVESLFDHYRLWCDFHGVNPFYQDKNTFAKEVYRRSPHLKTRAVRRLIDGERQIGFVGISRKYPEGWEPGAE